MKNKNSDLARNRNKQSENKEKSKCKKYGTKRNDEIVLNSNFQVKLEKQFQNLTLDFDENLVADQSENRTIHSEYNSNQKEIALLLRWKLSELN